MTNTTAASVLVASFGGARDFVADDLRVETGYLSVCDWRGSHDLVNTVGARLECVDCWYVTSERY